MVLRSGLVPTASGERGDGFYSDGIDSEGRHERHLHDEDWMRSEPPVRLPMDPDTLRYFVRPVADGLPDELCELLALPYTRGIVRVPWTRSSPTSATWLTRVLAPWRVQLECAPQHPVLALSSVGAHG